MPWPSRKEYEKAILKPDKSLAGLNRPKIQNAIAWESIEGDPVGFSGGFVYVYQVINGDGRKHAIRVFQQERTGESLRYKTIATDTSGNPFIVGTKYHLEGMEIELDNNQTVKTDITTMDWCEGDVWGKWMAGDQAEGDIFEIALRMVNCFRLLRSSGHDHGDLNPDNIMITNNLDVKLIDLDDFRTLNLVGLYQTGQLSLPKGSGKQGFRHPKRSSSDWEIGGHDNFTAWNMLFQMIVKARQPVLFETFFGKTGQESSLFSEKDLDNPQTSQVFSELLLCSDSVIVLGAQKLMEYCALGSTNAPSVDETVGEIEQKVGFIDINSSSNWVPTISGAIQVQPPPATQPTQVPLTLPPPTAPIPSVDPQLQALAAQVQQLTQLVTAQQQAQIAAQQRTQATQPQPIAQPSISVTPPSPLLPLLEVDGLNLENVNDDDSPNHHFVIKNPGNANLEISEINLKKELKGLSLVSLPMIVLPGLSQEFLFWFDPKGLSFGKHSAEIEIKSNAGDKTFELKLNHIKSQRQEAAIKRWENFTYGAISFVAVLVIIWMLWASWDNGREARKDTRTMNNLVQKLQSGEAPEAYIRKGSSSHFFEQPVGPGKIKVLAPPGAPLVWYLSKDKKSPRKEPDIIGPFSINEFVEIRQAGYVIVKTRGSDPLDPWKFIPAKTIYPLEVVVK